MSEEKKILLEDLEDILEEETSEESGKQRRLNFQTVYATLVLNWHWFLLSLIICLLGAFLYLRFTKPVYKVSARMLIKSEDKGRGNASQMLSGVEDLGFLSNTMGLDNEMEVLQSRVLLRDVVQDLKLYTEYRVKHGLWEKIVYNTQPLNIDLDPLHLDSLDFNLLEEKRWIDMKITKEDSGYVLSGKCMYDNSEGSTFLERIDTLPAAFNTALGTLTVTSNPERQWEEGTTYRIILQPPMAVATKYLKNLTVEPSSQRASIAELTLTDKNYRRGIDVLRQLTICYNRQANADKNEVALRTEEFINDRIAKIDRELGNAEGAIQRFKQTQSVTSIADATQSVQLSNEFSTRLATERSQIQLLDYMRDFVNNPDNRYQIIPSNVGVNDGASTALINTYNKAVQDRNRLLKSASEQAPQVRTLTATIDELQQSIQTALLQARRSADIRLQSVQSQLDKFQGRVSAAPHQERFLNEVGRQQEVKSSLYILLLQKREENSIALAATADNGKLIDEPLFEGKVSPRTFIVLAGSLLLALLIPTLVLWLLSLFRYKIEGHEDVSQLTNVPIIADVPMTSESVKQKAGIVVQANKNTAIDEIYRSMRTNIKFMLQGDQKVICFTSYTSGEGKTFNAANLAMSFALLGKSVILCGLDIRKPALGRLFGVSDCVEGITPLLTLEKVSKEALYSQIQESGINEHLDLLLAGPVPPNPAELLARENFADIVKILRASYDYVIFDTPPVGLVTDTLQIAQYADISVFVCRADYTPKSAFSLINSLADEKKLPNLCLVINGIDMSRRKYGYYYGFGKYGKYGRYGHSTYGNGQYGSYGNYGHYSESNYGDKDDDSIKR